MDSDNEESFFCCFFALLLTITMSEEKMKERTRKMIKIFFSIRLYNLKMLNAWKTPSIKGLRAWSRSLLLADRGAEKNAWLFIVFSPRNMIAVDESSAGEVRSLGNLISDSASLRLLLSSVDSPRVSINAPSLHQTCDATVKRWKLRIVGSPGLHEFLCPQPIIISNRTRNRAVTRRNKHRERTFDRRSEWERENFEFKNILSFCVRD